MPGPYSGADARNYVGFARETTRGTPVAPSAFIPYLSGVSIDHGSAHNWIKEAGASGMVTIAEKTAHIPVLGAPFLARPVVSTRLAALLLGVDTSTQIGVTGVYDHVVADDWDPDYVTAETNLADDIIERFQDCAVTELSFTVDRDNPILRGQVSILCGKVVFQAAATAETYETNAPFVLSDGTFTVDGSGTPLNKVVGFKFTIRCLQSAEKLAEVWPEHMTKNGFEVEVELTQFAADLDEAYRETHYGTTSGTTPVKTPDTGAFIADFAYGVTGTLRGLKLDAPNLYWGAATFAPGLDPNGAEAIKVTRTGVARKVSGANLANFRGETTDAASYLA